jgi:hypothetical protein
MDNSYMKKNTIQIILIQVDCYVSEMHVAVVTGINAGLKLRIKSKFGIFLIFLVVLNNLYICID